MRQFRATQWLMNGVDVNSFKELLGHSSMETTMKYVRYVEIFAEKTVAAGQQKKQTEWMNPEIGTGYKVDSLEKLG
jgi:integrase